jgi:hypothetical protein
MARFYRSAHERLSANDSGQAATELALAVTLLLIFVCASIDFGRSLYQMQVLSELSRQGADLALRLDGTTSCDNVCSAVAAVMTGSSGLNLSANGAVIISSLSQTATTGAGPSGGPYKIAEQVQQGGLSETSKLGKTGASVTITGAPGLQEGQFLYVAEIFYTFTPATGIGALTNNAIGLPSTLYDIAYF